MNDWIFGEREILVAKRIDRDHGIVRPLARLKYGRDALENCVTRIGHGRRSEFGDHNPIGGRVLFVRVRLHEATLIGHLAVADAEPLPKKCLLKVLTNSRDNE